jgi:hypothetical protein
MTQVELRYVAVQLSISFILFLFCSFHFSFYFFSADDVVSVLQGPIPSRSGELYPDQLWAPLSIPFSGCEADHSPAPSAEVNV